MRTLSLIVAFFAAVGCASSDSEPTSPSGAVDGGASEVISADVTLTADVGSPQELPADTNATPLEVAPTVDVTSDLGGPIENHGPNCVGKPTSCAAGTSCQQTKARDTAECLPDQPLEAPCGPGLGGCVLGAQCVSIDDTHILKKCYADLKDGAVCGTGHGGCAKGLSCGYTDTTFKERRCYPGQAVGKVCGAGIGGCVEGAYCEQPVQYTGKGVCVAIPKIGQECEGGGSPCEAGSHCVGGGGNQPTCKKDVGLGDTCGFSSGRCADGLACANQGAGMPRKCVEKSYAGQSCSQSNSACVDGLVCSTDGEANQVCAPAVGLGAKCGVSVACEQGLECTKAADGASYACTDPCETGKLYGNGACDGCWKNDVDCVCKPTCDGKACGSDGCGGTCGGCTGTDVCGHDFKCEAPYVSPCCAAGTTGKGCPTDKAVETCICAFAPGCCTQAWPAQCAEFVQESGCGICKL